MMARPPLHPNTSQGGQPHGPLLTTPGDILSSPLGAFEVPSPLTENSPRGSHAPEGETVPSPHHVHMRCWGHIKRVAHQFEQSWLGDLVGAVLVFGIGYLALLIGWIFN